MAGTDAVALRDGEELLSRIAALQLPPISEAEAEAAIARGCDTASERSDGRASLRSILQSARQATADVSAWCERLAMPAPPPMRTLLNSTLSAFEGRCV